jgi:hypothetical protein
MNGIGLSFEELQREIEVRMERLDEAQIEDDQLGQFGDLLRTAAVIAFQRAAELIDANNRRIEAQLRAAGIEL